MGALAPEDPPPTAQHRCAALELPLPPWPRFGPAETTCQVLNVLPLESRSPDAWVWAISRSAGSGTFLHVMCVTCVVQLWLWTGLWVRPVLGD